MSNIKSLLDFTKLKGPNEVQSRFSEVAAKLFSSYVFETQNGEKFNITDLELYLHNKDTFQDPFMTARHHTQLTSGYFYIHRSKKNNKQFKRPNFIGLDITCGSAFECFGGLLIRAIKNTETGKEIDGCAKVLNYIVSGVEDCKLISKKWSESDLKVLGEIDDCSISNCSVLKLVDCENLNIDHFFIGERAHGQSLDTSKHEEYSSYNLKAISPISEKSKSKMVTYNFTDQSSRMVS